MSTLGLMLEPPHSPVFVVETMMRARDWQCLERNGHISGVATASWLAARCDLCAAGNSKLHRRWSSGSGPMGTPICSSMVLERSRSLA